MTQEDQNAELQPATLEPVPGAAGDLNGPANPAVSVRLELPVTQLARKAREVLRSSTAIGSEIGGLLLGTAAAGDPVPVTISDYELVACDHKLGPLYKLGGADLERLDEAIARLKTDSRGLEVVGFFRSHTRPGMSPDANDLAVCSSRFSKPHQIALLVRPNATEAGGVGVFVWQGGALCEYMAPSESPSQVGTAKPDPPANSTVATPEPDPAPVREAPKRATVVPIESRRPSTPAASESDPLPAVAEEAGQAPAASPAAAPATSVKSAASAGRARVGRCNVSVRLGPDPRRAGSAAASREPSRRDS
ncbi:MAG TPA: hypothetical protein VMJ75_04195 [Candidatus Acidoferrales bacterium]|nr:hypothetical protein [Candidatus Acidoferrales bacterium]